MALVMSALVASCGRVKGQGELDWETATLEEKLEYMRSDSSWIVELDSLAAFSLGEGASCTNPVKHTFSYDGRTWIYNQDWGGVLEIPGDYVVEDDATLAVLSFHGNRVFSPDSLVMISTYAGFQCIGYEDFAEAARTQFDDQPFVKVTSFRETEVRFHGGHVSKALEMETRTGDGIFGWARYIFASAEGVEYDIFIQYPEDMEEQVSRVKEMVKRYPFSPDGSDPYGECI